MSKLFEIPNNEEGREFIKTLRKHLRNSPKGIKLRGRGPRDGSYTQQNSLRLGLSNRFAVYLYTKDTTRIEKVVDLSAPDGYRWISKPTKWHPKFKELVGGI
jgi:hypothetical protein